MSPNNSRDQTRGHFALKYLNKQEKIYSYVKEIKQSDIKTEIHASFHSLVLLKSSEEEAKTLRTSKKLEDFYFF